MATLSRFLTQFEVLEAKLTQLRRAWNEHDDWAKRTVTAMLGDNPPQLKEKKCATQREVRKAIDRLIVLDEHLELRISKLADWHVSAEHESLDSRFQDAMSTPAIGTEANVWRLISVLFETDHDMMIELAVFSELEGEMGEDLADMECTCKKHATLLHSEAFKTFASSTTD